MTLQPLTPTDAPTLSSLAKNIYREHYLHLWNPGGADWYMHEYAYPEETLHNELADPLNLHFMAMENGSAVGYLKLRLCYGEDETAMELERIYLHQHAAGKGLGKEMMLFSENIARACGKKQIYLKAMDSSTDAIGFYKHLGYIPCGELTLPFEQMKTGYRGMIILRKELQEQK